MELFDDRVRKEISSNFRWTIGVVMTVWWLL